MVKTSPDTCIECTGSNEDAENTSSPNCHVGYIAGYNISQRIFVFLLALTVPVGSFAAGFTNPIAGEYS
jgi:hypothetical protein